MSELPDEAVEKLVASSPVRTFKNEHGEVYNIHYLFPTIYLSGDEVDAWVDKEAKLANKYTPLFNGCFDIWSKDELYKLGVALQELASGVTEESPKPTLQKDEE